MGLVYWENCSWRSVVQTEPKFTLGLSKARSNSHPTCYYKWGSLPLCWSVLAQKLGRTEPLVLEYKTNNIYNLLVITKCLDFHISFLSTSNSPWRWELLFQKIIIFFFRKGNWVSEMVGKLSKTVQLISGRARSLTNFNIWLL